MSEELYVNKRGFKCVLSQLAKTDGLDPQEHGMIMARWNMVPVEDRDAAWKAARDADLAALPVKEAKYARVDVVNP